jgi:hypothetical protein
MIAWLGGLAIETRRQVSSRSNFEVKTTPTSWRVGSAKLATVDLPPVWPVEATRVFDALPPALDARLKAACARYYAHKLSPDEIMAPRHIRKRFAYMCKESRISIGCCA